MLGQFVDRLLAEKKMSNLEPGILQQAKEDILAKAEEKIKAVIFSNIPSDKLEKFDELMDANDEESLQAFIKKEIPDLDQVIAAGLLEFRHTYLG